MKQERTNIKCPNCGFEIDVNEILYHQLEEVIKKDYDQRSVKKEKDIQSRLQSLRLEQEKFEKEKQEMDSLVTDQVSLKLKEERANIEKDFRIKFEKENESQLGELKKELEEKSAQVKDLNKTKAEIERLKREKEELSDKITLEKEVEFSDKLKNERSKITKQVEDSIAMKLKEREKVIDDLKTQLNEAKRKAEQGSMQLQGEVQELAIEEWLKAKFPLDTIGEVKKGARGADCLQIVNTQLRQNCGSIYYESKRTKDFQPSWIEKFKTDMRSKGAAFGVLVTDVMPKDMDRLGQKDGIWICTFEEFKGLCFVIREAVVLLNNAVATQENKGDKVNMLYDYLTGNEFRQQIEAIVEGFTQMSHDLDSERRAMEGIWKKREKQIQKVLLNTNHMYHSIKGIAGNAIGTIKMLELPAGDEDDS